MATRNARTHNSLANHATCLLEVVARSDVSVRSAALASSVITRVVDRWRWIERPAARRGAGRTKETAEHHARTPPATLRERPPIPCHASIATYSRAGRHRERNPPPSRNPRTVPCKGSPINCCCCYCCRRRNPTDCILNRSTRWVVQTAVAVILL